MELRGKNIVVVGMARTGIATARFLLDRGARVTVSEAKPAAQLPAEALALAQQGVLLETGGHRMETLRGAELIVVSPGVPLDIAPLRAADKSGIEIISEIELAYRFLQTPLIAVTGTNGKTTTTSLLGEHVPACRQKSVCRRKYWHAAHSIRIRHAGPGFCNC